MSAHARQVRDSARWSRVRLLVCDVDGTMTDGGLAFDSEGRETKVFHVRDGYGLVLLRAAGIPVAWISGRDSAVTTLRARELKIPHLIQPESDKAAALRRLTAQLGVELAEVCYVGDDTNDLGAMALSGISCAPADSHPDVLAAVHHVTTAPGGRGAVRELCDLIVSNRPPKARA
jgi:3-deoxy-D-manno-octulosonate 8-phosphate phosphatase (KDO 8-P phosphatase)